MIARNSPIWFPRLGHNNRLKGLLLLNITPRRCNPDQILNVAPMEPMRACRLPHPSLNRHFGIIEVNLYLGSRRIILKLDASCRRLVVFRSERVHRCPNLPHLGDGILWKARVGDRGVQVRLTALLEEIFVLWGVGISGLRLGSAVFLENGLGLLVLVEVIVELSKFLLL